MLNVSVIFEIDPQIGFGALERAVNRVLKHHPVFSSVLGKDPNGNITLRYELERFVPIETEFLSDEEFDDLRDTLCRPITLFDSLLYHIRIFKTPAHSYLLMNIHHLITDGTSMNLILRQICACAKEDEYILPPDYYFLSLQDRHEKEGSGTLQELRGLYTERFRRFQEKQMCMHPKEDLCGDGFDMGYTERVIPIKSDFGGSTLCAEAGSNVVLMAALAITLSSDNGCNNVYLTWISNGRNSALRINAAGLLISSVPLFIEIGGNETVKELFDDIRGQVNFGMANADAGCSIPDINEREPAVFLLQTEFILFEEIDGVRRVISLEEKRDEADSLFEFSISKQYSTGNFVCEAEYSANRYSKERMERFMDDYANKLKLLLLAGPETKVQDILKFHRLDESR